MYRQFRVLFVLFALTFVTQSSWSQVPPDLSPEFHFDHTIVIDTSLVVAAIAGLSVSPDLVVVMDRIGQGVYIIRHDGSAVSSLTIETCYPGSPFVPLSVRMDGDQILVVNSGTPMLRFDLEGTCLGTVDKALRAVALWDLNASGQIATLNEWNDLISIYGRDGKLLQKAIARYPKFKQLEMRWAGGGLRWWGLDQLVIVGVVPDSLVVLDNITRSIERKTHGLSSPIIRLPDGDDLPVLNTASMFVAFQKIAAVATLVTNLFVLNEQSLILTFNNPDDRGYVLLNRDGIVGKGWTGKHQIVHVSENRLYIVYQPPFTEDGRIPNPQIFVYRHE